MAQSALVPIERHLTETELECWIDRIGDCRSLQRLVFIKRLYEGHSLSEAAETVLLAESAGREMIDQWNADGLAGIIPDNKYRQFMLSWGDQRREVEQILAEDDHL